MEIYNIYTYKQVHVDKQHTGNICIDCTYIHEYMYHIFTKP